MIKKFAIPLIALVALTLVVGLALPRGWRVEQELVIAAPPQRIFPLLFDLKRWQEWSVWTRTMDPQLRNTYEGPSDGVGAKWLWLGPKMGRGQLLIVASDPVRGIELEESIEAEVPNAHASIAFTAVSGGTRVTWLDQGTLPPIVGGFFRGVVEDRLNADFSTSLRKLKSIVEGQPELGAGSP